MQNAVFISIASFMQSFLKQGLQNKSKESFKGYIDLMLNNFEYQNEVAILLLIYSVPSDYHVQKPMIVYSCQRQLFLKSIHFFIDQIST